MRIRTSKNIDVDFEADVDIEDVLAEFGQRAEETGHNTYKWLLPTLDWMTRILAKVNDETIAAMPGQARQELHKRLSEQAARYEN